LAFVRVVTWLIAGGCAAGAAWIGFHLIRNTAKRVRITEEGIEDGTRIHPWAAVAGVGATPTAGGVLVVYELRSKASVVPRVLMTTPPLTREEFRTLIDQLREHLAHAHPHVTLDPEPRLD
jgi:hypothetical protein